jgi:hypothetical protein
MTPPTRQQLLYRRERNSLATVLPSQQSAKFAAIAVCMLLAHSSEVQAEDWTRFRGNDGQGIVESVAPLEWTTTEHVEWKLDLPGAGSSSPIVIGDKVFVTCYSGDTGAA